MVTSIQIQPQTREGVEKVKAEYKEMLEKKQIHGSHVSISMVIDYLLKFYFDNKDMVKMEMIE